VETSEFLLNPRRDEKARFRPSSHAAMEFHRRLPAYRPTRLLRLDVLAEELGLERLWIKDESNRLGLPAFKFLGVSWAAYRALVDRLDAEPAWRNLDDLRRSFAPLRPLSLVTATTGNHGRAVARVASLFGLTARIFVPAQAPADRVAAIASEGAQIVNGTGSYDDAVEQAANWADGQADEQVLLLSDTAPTTEDRVSNWISEGYSTLFWETEDQLSTAGEMGPDTVLIQIGAGSLALAAATHFRRQGVPFETTLIGVEAASAACFQASARAGAFRTIQSDRDSQMFCLNVGVPSRSGIDTILKGFDAFVAIGDAGLGPASRALANSGVVAGPTGAAGLVGAREALPWLSARESRRVLVINTEGAADPTGYAHALLA